MSARIWLYLREFPPTGAPLNGGMSKAVHGLATGLVGAGADVTVLCEDFDAPDAIARGTGGYTIRSFRNPERITPFGSIAPGLQEFIATADRPAVAVINGIFHPRLHLVARALRQHDLPYVVAPHDPYHPEIFRRRKFVKWLYWYLFEGPMLRKADRVQLLDIRHAQWLQRLGIYTPVVEVQNGFATEDLDATPEPQWRLSGPASLLFLGRLDTHNKGLDVLIDGFAGLSPSANAHLTIQGPDWGDKLTLQRKIADDKLESRVSLLGPDYETRSPVITAKHDIFCLPSRFEGFGLSALEAMLAARVLLVTEVAGIAPHVRASQCGVVVSPEPVSIRRGIEQLLACRPQWKEMGLRGRAHAVENLRWDRISERVLPQYRALMRSSTSAAVASSNVATQSAAEISDAPAVPPFSGAGSSST